jgi:Lysozyme like domain
MDYPGSARGFGDRDPFRSEYKTHHSAFDIFMSPVLILIAAILGIGIWGYVQRGDALYVVNKLSASDIATYAANAGFTGDDLVTAVAIALAESGGDPQALGDTTITPGGSLGLWQINLRWHPEFQANPNALYDPQTNANAAYSVFKQQGFSAWSTFNGGQYSAHLADASAAVNG